MVKMYGAQICGDCRDALETFHKKGFTDFTYIEITESTQNLREFLHLRDTRPELKTARDEGFIGIPCYVLEDGSVTLDTEEIVK